MLRVRVSDAGPGIAQLESILEGRYRSTTGMGIGLAGTRRIMDAFHVATEPGNTVITVGKILPPESHLDLQAITAKLAGQRTRSAPEEVLTQNHELLEALEAVRLREAQLMRRESELTRLNSELEETNRGVVALYAELDEKAVELRAADELKSRFLSHVSHEFRTPVNSIMGLTSLLLRRIDGDLSGEQERQVGYIRQAAGELLELVNDLLDLAKVASGKTEVTLAPVDLGQFLRAQRGLLRPLATGDGVVLVFDDPPEILIETDESKLGQILRNLVSNALKFTERGEVRVSSATSGQVLRIAVADTGIGVPVEQQERIFQEFTQVRGPMQTKYKGTGLGLPLSRKLAHLLGGSLTLNSVPGEGATFVLEIPLHQADLEEREISPVSDVILIIDDEETSRYIAAQRFRGSRYRIIEASSGAEGAERARFERPALILLDLNMPDRTGFEVLDDLKSDPSTKTIPVVIHTSRRLNQRDYERLAGRQAAILSKEDKDNSEALAAIREVLNEPLMFADELSITPQPGGPERRPEEPS